MLKETPTTLCPRLNTSFKNVTAEISIRSSHRAYFHRYSDSFEKKPSTIDSGTCEHKQEHKYQGLPFLQYHKRNEEVGGRESHERPGPVSTYWITLLCDTRADDQQSHFMWVPCGGPSAHWFICLLSISDNNQGSILETSQNGILNKTKQGLLLSWGPLYNRQPDAHKITTLMN